MKRGHAITVAAVLLALSGGCETVRTTAPGTVGVERQQTMLLSSQEVDKSAARAYDALLQEASRHGLLNRNPVEVARVRRISRRLIAQTTVFRADAGSWRWEINVITSKEVNAWCMPGGKIAVYTGLIERLRPTDDELAAVLGHEIAHALREHGRERASQVMTQSMAISIIGAATGMSGSAQDLSQVVLDVTLNLPNSRAFETEADRIGVELAARAGYDPRAAVSLWQKMSALGGGQPPQFLSTHPSYQSRIGDLKVYAERVMPLYEQSRTRP
jgi:predicted Zn-dependent protease